MVKPTKAFIEETTNFYYTEYTNRMEILSINKSKIIKEFIKILEEEKNIKIDKRIYTNSKIWQMVKINVVENLVKNLIPDVKSWDIFKQDIWTVAILLDKENYQNYLYSRVVENIIKEININYNDLDKINLLITDLNGNFYSNIFNY